MSIIRTLSFDWKSSGEETAEELKPILKEFGVYVYDDPRYDGTDEVGLVFSDKPLTKKEINGICES